MKKGTENPVFTRIFILKLENTCIIMNTSVQKEDGSDAIFGILLVWTHLFLQRDLKEK